MNTNIKPLMDPKNPKWEILKDVTDKTERTFLKQVVYMYWVCYRLGMDWTELELFELISALRLLYRTDGLEKCALFFSSLIEKLLPPETPRENINKPLGLYKPDTKSVVLIAMYISPTNPHLKLQIRVRRGSVIVRTYSCENDEFDWTTESTESVMKHLETPEAACTQVLCKTTQSMGEVHAKRFCNEPITEKAADLTWAVLTVLMGMIPSKIIVSTFMVNRPEAN